MSQKASCTITGERQQIVHLAKFANAHGYRVSCVAHEQSRQQSPASSSSSSSSSSPQQQPLSSPSSSSVAPPQRRIAPTLVTSATSAKGSSGEGGGNSSPSNAPRTHNAMKQRVAEIDRRLEQLQREIDVINRVKSLQRDAQRASGDERDRLVQELLALGKKVKVGTNPRLEMTMLKAEGRELEALLARPEKKSPRNKRNVSGAGGGKKQASKGGVRKWTSKQKKRLQAFLDTLHARHSQSLTGPVHIIRLFTSTSDFGDSEVNSAFRSFFRAHADGIVVHPIVSGHINHKNNSLVEFTQDGGGSLLGPFQRHRVNVHSQICIRRESLNRYQCQRIYNLKRGGLLNPDTNEPEKGLKPMVVYSRAVKALRRQ